MKLMKLEQNLEGVICHTSAEHPPQSALFLFQPGATRPFSQHPWSVFFFFLNFVFSQACEQSILLRAKNGEGTARKKADFFPFTL